MDDRAAEPCRLSGASFCLGVREAPAGRQRGGVRRSRRQAPATCPSQERRACLRVLLLSREAAAGRWLSSPRMSLSESLGARIRPPVERRDSLTAPIFVRVLPKARVGKAVASRQPVAQPAGGRRRLGYALLDSGRR